MTVETAGVSTYRLQASAGSKTDIHGVDPPYKMPIPQKKHPVFTDRAFLSLSQLER